MQTEKQSFLLTFWSSNRLTIKGLMVGFLILVMLIPAIFVGNLVSERKARQQEVINEVSSSWASAQTISGPYITIPYKERATTSDGKVVELRKWATFLPEQLKVNTILVPERRHRSIFTIMVYKSDVNFQGNFSGLSLKTIKLSKDDLLLDEAYLCMGLSDFRGIENGVTIQWNDTSYEMNSGLPEISYSKTNDDVVMPTADQGLSVPIKLSIADLDKHHSFSMKLKLKGSEQLYVVPLGKTTEVQMSSTWNKPAFDGGFLPDNYVVNESGFTANWKILHLNRAFPQEWKDRKFDINSSAFGVNLLQTGDTYSKTERSVKYSILFITLTFLLYFFVEILQGRNVHPLQYILVGIAIIIFYTLLLSISEYLGFNAGYLISSSATVLLITAYTKSIFEDWKIVTIFFGVLAALYGFIFVLIQLQDGALLFGSIGLFIILAIVMYYSRKVSWYGQRVVIAKQ